MTGARARPGSDDAAGDGGAAAGMAVDIKIKNTGPQRGEEVVQLYIGKEGPVVDRPVKELKGNKK